MDQGDTHIEDHTDDPIDEVARYNIARWDALVAANALFTRPAVNLDAASARQMLDPENRLGALTGKRVLCLACGGGQQSIAFALLGAQATVFDLSAAQLQRDAEAAVRYGVDIKIAQGDMRDLSAFADDTFDIVYHAYSLSFVPAARIVFQQVARVLRPSGIYRFHVANPFVQGMTHVNWNGEGYTIRSPYVEGAQVTYSDQEWVYDRSKGEKAINAPREYRHTLSALIDGLVEAGFLLHHISDRAAFDPDPNAEPGTWSHFVAFAPPWLLFWTTYRPDVVKPL